jgi:hypothetical protein
VEAYNELSDVLYREIGLRLLMAFQCSNFEALEKKEIAILSRAPLMRALRYGSKKRVWTGLRLATIKKEDFLAVVSETGNLLKDDQNSLMSEIHILLVYERYPQEIAVACARKLMKWEERLRGIKVKRWLDLLAYAAYD